MLQSDSGMRVRVLRGHAQTMVCASQTATVGSGLRDGCGRSRSAGYTRTTEQSGARRASPPAQGRPAASTALVCRESFHSDQEPLRVVGGASGADAAAVCIVRWFVQKEGVSPTST